LAHVLLVNLGTSNWLGHSGSSKSADLSQPQGGTRQRRDYKQRAPANSLREGEEEEGRRRRRRGGEEEEENKVGQRTQKHDGTQHAFF